MDLDRNIPVSIAASGKISWTLKTKKHLCLTEANFPTGPSVIGGERLKTASNGPFENKETTNVRKLKPRKPSPRINRLDFLFGNG